MISTSTQRWNGRPLSSVAPAVTLSPEETGPETALWAAVLVQAIKDACAPLRFVRGAERREEERDRDDARAFLLSGNRNFRLVCGGAGYDPSRIRPAMQRLAAAGWPPALIEKGLPL